MPKCIKFLSSTFPALHYVLDVSVQYTALIKYAQRKQNQCFNSERNGCNIEKGNHFVVSDAACMIQKLTDCYNNFFIVIFLAREIRYVVLQFISYVPYIFLKSMSTRL